jgi:hypothetical protein
MNAEHKPAEIVAVRAANEEDTIRMIAPNQENAMSQESLPLPLPMALRAEDLADQEFNALLRNVKDPNATAGRLKRIPRGIASPEFETANLR